MSRIVVNEGDFARLEESITIAAHAFDNRVRGVSGAVGYNKGNLDSWSSGNLRGAPSAQVRDVRKFRGLVAWADQEARFTGRRTAFHCAEVNAVVMLLGKGAGLTDITLGEPLGEQRQRVRFCKACRIWIPLSGIESRYIAIR